MFEHGETRKTITIPIYDDKAVEPDEAFVVKLLPGTFDPSLAVLGEQSMTRIHIIDDDLPMDFIDDDRPMELLTQSSSSKPLGTRVDGPSSAPTRLVGGLSYREPTGSLPRSGVDTYGSQFANDANSYEVEERAPSQSVGREQYGRR